MMVLPEVTPADDCLHRAWNIRCACGRLHENAGNELTQTQALQEECSSHDVQHETMADAGSLKRPTCSHRSDHPFPQVS